MYMYHVPCINVHVRTIQDDSLARVIIGDFVCGKLILDTNRPLSAKNGYEIVLIFTFMRKVLHAHVLYMYFKYIKYIQSILFSIDMYCNKTKCFVVYNFIVCL